MRLIGPCNVDYLLERGFSEVSIDSAIYSTGIALANAVHSLPWHVKETMLAAPESGVLGYYPSERDVRASTERARNVAVLSGARARGYSSFDFIAEELTGHTTILKSNRWPGGAAAMRREAESAYAQLAEAVRWLSQQLIDELISRHLMSENHRAVLDGPCCSLMRLLAYDAQEEPITSKEHTDYELLSLVMSDHAALEVKLPNGEWVTPDAKGTVALVLAGDMLEALTNGAVQSCLHRVRLARDHRRSVIFFQGLPLGTQIRYERLGVRCPTTFGNHILPLLVRGAAHLASHHKRIAEELRTEIPESNLFKRGK